MTDLLLNSFLMLVVLFFGAMAYYPLFLKSADTEAPVEAFSDDVVISIAPAPMERKAPRPIILPRPGGNGPEHPGHRPAA